MPNKMTDKEIIMATKLLLELVFVKDCLQRVKIVSNVFDLINRQKAEIERLNKAIQVQEIMLENAINKVKKAKAEAVKEFAERAKTEKAIHNCECGKFFDYTDVFNDYIDNLLKEKVGENDAS